MRTDLFSLMRYLPQNTNNCYTRFFALTWLLLCILMLITLVWILPQAQINSSVLALLPKENARVDVLGEVMPDALENMFMQRLDKQLVWMVSPSDMGSQSTAPVEWWYEQLQKADAFKSVKGSMTDDELEQWGAFSYKHRYQMLDAQTRARLENNTQGQWILAQLYSAFAGVSGAELSSDPLLLVRGAQLSQLDEQKASRLALKDRWLVASDDEGRDWYFMYGELAKPSDELGSNQTTVTQLKLMEDALHAKWPDAQVLSRGALFYNEYASSQAQGDITRLGTVTLCGMLLMIFFVYRSMRPILLCLLSIGTGVLAGTVTTLLLFGEVHLMTLVLSISAVGVSTDYAIYYLTERVVHGKNSTPFESAHKIASAQWIALITTALAYLIMLLAPFPGLKQLAVFAAAGLTAAGLTVMYWFPYLVKNLPVRPIPAVALIMRWLYLWRKNKGVRYGIPIILIIFSAYGISRLTINDDVAQLQSLPQSIVAQEHKITELSGQGMDQKWFVVYGKSEEQALQRLEAFRPHLNKAKQQGLLTTARILPLNSLHQQQQDAALLQAKQSDILNQLQAVGVTANSSTIAFTPLIIEQWANSIVSQGWGLLWATLDNGETAILVPVSGVVDTNALNMLAKELPGVFWEDRKASFNELFYHYRTMLSWLLLGAAVFLAVSYIARLGLKNGIISIIPSVLSLSVSLAVLAVLGRPLNLFALLALILVLGIGVNYTLFFSNSKSTATTSMLATILAFFTTQITLGILVLSTTQAISSFGLVLMSGVFVAFLLSPLALLPKNRKKENKKLGGETK